MAFSMEEFTREVAERLDAWEENNREVAQLNKRLESGEATYADVERLASLTGRSTGKVLADALVQNAVDGKVTEDVARAILSKPLEDNYNRIAEACRLAQEALNRKAGLGLNAVRPNLPRGRIDGIITETAGKEDVNSFAGTLVQQVENLSLSTVDDSVRENAAAHSRAGLRPKIRRIADSDCCDWCSTLEGTYDYAEVSDTGNDVFRRHANCRCQVIYDPADGKRWQDAHSKRLLSADERAKIEARKTYGLDEERKTPEQRVAEAEKLNDVSKGASKINDEILLTKQRSGLEPLMRRYINRDEQLYKNLAKVKPIDGFEDFAFHGKPNSIIHTTTNGQNIEYTAKEFADMLRSDPEYKGGDIRLLSCNTGQRDGGFAYQLAQELHVNVLAPTEVLWTNENGDLFISDSEVLAEMWYDGEKVNQTGNWRLFKPQENVQ